MTKRLNGLVIRSQSGFYTVVTENGSLFCQLRGRLKKGPRAGDLVTIGDRVDVTELGDKKGVIEEVKPRLRMFSRMAPNPQGEYQQILIANPDQIVIVFACADPAPRFGMLDRFLVIAEKQNVPSLIVANKVDLVAEKTSRDQFSHYKPLEYRLLYSSVKTGQGINELHEQLRGKISLFTGPSGAGKSSILNAIQPGLGLQVKKVSRATSKGRHTTVVRELFPLADGGYVADTPGLKALALWDIEPEELDGYFPEIRERVMDCQFNDCTHVHEPGCAVLDALKKGIINPQRYNSYLHMRFEEDDLERILQIKSG